MPKSMGTYVCCTSPTCKLELLRHQWPPASPSGMSFTESAQRKPARHESPTTSPPCSKASGIIVWAIMVSIAPAAKPSTATIVSAASLVEAESAAPGGKSTAPSADPAAVRAVVASHISKMLRTFMPCAFMLPDELIASGKLLMKTPITKGNAAAAALLDWSASSPPTALLLMMMPITKDSGTASIRIPSQTITALCLAALLTKWWLWPWPCEWPWLWSSEVVGDILPTTAEDGDAATKVANFFAGPPAKSASAWRTALDAELGVGKPKLMLSFSESGTHDRFELERREEFPAKSIKSISCSAKSMSVTCPMGNAALSPSLGIFKLSSSLLESSGSSHPK
mmetsp:Transcript_107233/g.277478  ORF Transcript_107233/g.277478 Transcript_107233/m.277478 type:complete len:340 (+) Transcript_107233:226-1245(+)